MAKRSSRERTKDEDPVSDLLKKAEKHVDKFEYDVALQYFNRVLQLRPDSVEALETSAACLLESGQVDMAKSMSAKFHRLERAVELKPDDGHGKLLSLAQLCDGRDALNFYIRGIDVMKTKLEAGLVGDDEKALLLREISAAHCSVAELYTTDLCFEENAETECSTNIEEAIAVDAGNPEALQAKANFLLIKEDYEEAKVAMSASLSLWLPKMKDILQGNSETDDPFEVCPVSYDTRVSAAKILIELEDYETAAEVLEGLLSEDDEVVQVWYLSGFMNLLRGDEFVGNARYYLNRAKKVALKTMTGDSDVLQHVDEMLNEIGPDDEVEETEEDDGDETSSEGEDETGNEGEDKENEMQT